MDITDKIYDENKESWKNKLEECETKIEQGLANNDDYIHAISCSSVLNYEDNIIEEKTQRAIAFIKRQISEDPNLPENYSSLAQVYSLAQKDIEAEKYFNTALSLDPNCKSALKGLSFLASLAVNKNGYETAITYLDKIIETDPTDFEVFKDRAIYKGLAGQTGAAIEDLNKILSFDIDEKTRKTTLKQIEIIKNLDSPSSNIGLSGFGANEKFKSSDFDKQTLKTNTSPLSSIVNICFVLIGIAILVYFFVFAN